MFNTHYMRHPLRRFPLIAAVPNLFGLGKDMAATDGGRQLMTICKEDLIRFDSNQTVAPGRMESICSSILLRHAFRSFGVRRRSFDSSLTTTHPIPRRFGLLMDRPLP